MTHYQKIATMTFRIIGLVITLYSLVSILIIFTLNFVEKYTLLFYSFLPYVFLGTILIILSKSFAKWICMDFGNSDE